MRTCAPSWLDLLQLRPWSFIPRVLITVSAHVETVLHGMVQVFVSPGNWSFSSIAANEPFVGHPWRPFLSRFEHHGRSLIRAERCQWHCRSDRCAEGTGSHFWKKTENTILFLQALRRCVIENTGSAVGM